MQAEPLAIAGVIKFSHDVWRDDRGLFLESWNERALAQQGLDVRFVQDNMSLSRQWTVRGLHYQIEQPQGKLIRVITGAVYDVIVDLRRSSPTFRRALGVRLTAERFESLWVPPGCAHGFLALADDTRVAYKVTDFWAPQHERTLLWNDPALDIPWPLPAGVAPIVSAKDAAGLHLHEAPDYP
jgi:dTDP-4-dehydrorhamnose 3,5-epimerase